MLKWIVGIVIVLGVLGGAAGLVVVKTDVIGKFKGNTGDNATEVQIEAVTRGDLKRTVSAPGSIEPRTLVKISSQVSAKVLALPFEEGDLVKAGETVVRLDPQDLEARLKSAQAGLKSEQARKLGSDAQLITARLEFERLTSLHETGDIPKAELERAEASYLSTKASVQMIEHSIEQAQASIEQAQKDLDNTVISSPMDGQITALNTEVGETVIVGTTNNPGSVIMEVADLSEMLLKAQVDESNIAPVEVGQQATVFINAYPDREFTGTIQKIGLKRQVAADGTGVFEVEILLDLEEGDKLYSGLTASTDIVVESFYDALVVPSQTVLDRRVDDLDDEAKKSEHVDEEKTFARVVYEFVDGQAIARPVTVGASDLTHTVIEGGIDEGVQVVAGPYRVLVDLKHEQKIKDKKAKKDEEKEDGEEGVAADDEVAGEEGVDSSAVSEGDEDAAASDETDEPTEDSASEQDEEVAAP